MCESDSSERAQERKTTSGQEKCRKVPTLANECDTPFPESSLVQPSPKMSGHTVDETTIEMFSLKTVSENATTFVRPPDSDTEEGEIVESSEGEEEGAIFDGEEKAGRVEEEVDSRMVEEIVDSRLEEERDMVDSRMVEEEGETVDSRMVEKEGETVDSRMEEEEGETVDTGMVEEEGEIVDSRMVEKEGETVDSRMEEEEGETVNSRMEEEEGETVNSRMEEEEGEIVDEERELVNSERREEMVGIKRTPVEWETEGHTSVSSESCGLGEQKARKNRLKVRQLDLVQTKEMELKVTPLPLLQSSGKQPGVGGKRAGCKAAHTSPRKRQRVIIEPPSCLSPPSLEATPEHILPGYRLRSRCVDFWEIAPKRRRSSSDGKVPPH